MKKHDHDAHPPKIGEIAVDDEEDWQTVMEGKLKEITLRTNE